MLYCAGGQELLLIMEYLPLGSLVTYLPNRKLDMSQLMIFALQICEVSFGGVLCKIY